MRSFICSTSAHLLQIKVIGRQLKAYNIPRVIVFKVIKAKRNMTTTYLQLNHHHQRLQLLWLLLRLVLTVSLQRHNRKQQQLLRKRQRQLSRRGQRPEEQQPVISGNRLLPPRQKKKTNLNRRPPPPQQPITGPRPIPTTAQSPPLKSRSRELKPPPQPASGANTWRTLVAGYEEPYQPRSKTT